LLPALWLVLLAPGVAGAQGILLLAHGGRADWNQEVLGLADRVSSSVPVEVAFGMANKRTIQEALDRLAEHEVTSIFAVPLFISSHSSVMRATEYLLGSRDEAPPEMEVFARMAARRRSGGTADSGFDWTTPVEPRVPISVGPALDGHPLVADILISRALDVSESPEDEVAVVVAHGPSSEADNELWLGNMGILVDEMRDRTGFSRIEHLTVRDDASEPVRDQATEELRAVVEGAVDEGRSVLIVPLLLSYGGIETGIRRRLEGLPYRMAGQALLPDERLSEWVLLQVAER
jgi:sirohydrochlorin ferrochelatase